MQRCWLVWETIACGLIQSSVSRVQNAIVQTEGGNKEMKLRIVLVIVFAVVLLGTALPHNVAGQATTPEGKRQAAVTLTTNAVVRGWPEDSAQVLGTLPSGSIVPTNGRLEDSKWWQIPYPGGPDGNGWLKAADLKPNAAAADVPVYALPTATPAPTGQAMLTFTADATVMAWPDDNAQQLGKLPSGSSVPTNGRLEDSQWWQVPYPGGPNGNGWVPASAVEPNPAASQVPIIEVVVPTPEVTPAVPTPAGCQFNAVFVTDVTIPDNSVIGAAQAFNKVWRLQNTGSCPWAASTLLNFVGGNRLGAQATAPVPPTAPGATADIPVTMYAPSAPGVYEGIWQLEDNGLFFGPRVSVVIQVPGAPQPTAAPPPPPPTAQPQPTAAPQPSINFYADTDRVAPGQCTNLHWNVNQAQAVYLQYQNHSDGVPGQSSRQVCPSTDGKRYTLIVIGYDGQQHQNEVQINIDNPAVSINFWADHNEVTIGTCTNVNWQVANAQRVQYNDGSGWKDVDKNSGSRQVCPAYPINCQLRVTDLDGNDHDRSVTIKTKAPPPGVLTPTPLKKK